LTEPPFASVSVNSGAGFRSLEVSEAVFFEEALFVEDEAEHDDKMAATAKAASAQDLQRVSELTILSVSLAHAALTFCATSKVCLKPHLPAPFPARA
jgi:hypothetical protein